MERKKAIHRLFEYFENKGLKASRVEAELGLGNNHFGKQLKSNGTINSDTLEKLALHFPDLNLDWLVTGRDVFENIRIGTSNIESLLEARVSLLEVTLSGLLRDLKSSGNGK